MCVAVSTQALTECDAMGAGHIAPSRIVHGDARSRVFGRCPKPSYQAVENTRMKLLELLLLGAIAVGGCTNRADQCNSNADCTDPAYPFCDVNGGSGAAGRARIAMLDGTIQTDPSSIMSVVLTTDTLVVQ